MSIFMKVWQGLLRSKVERSGSEPGARNRATA